MSISQGLTLGIETSCDETAVAVVREGKYIVSNVVSSQIPLHRVYGGVVPEVASRKHVESILPVIDQALAQAGVTLYQLELIAVTTGPGLVGALLVGVATAKAMAAALNKPLVAVNHIEGHIYANVLGTPDLQPPFVCLTVSGGHTDLLYVPKFGEYELLGRTRDDAAGEAFDKLGRQLGLPYPAGREMDILAAEGDKEAFDFPRGLANDGSFDFSFSGLKTCALNLLNRLEQQGQSIPLHDFAASYQWAIVDVLGAKLMAAAEAKGVQQIVLSGGVAANSSLRSHVQALAVAKGFVCAVPPLELCTDNGAMIASAGYFRYKRGERAGWDLNAEPSLRLV